MEVRWMTRVNDDGEEVKFYPVTHINAIVDDNEVPMPELINGVQTSVTNLEAEVEATKKSVSDGKILVADAITAKGVNTATDATFATMASNISSIDTLTTGTADATATAAQILSGQTAYVDGVKVTGTMANRAGSTTWWSGYENCVVQTHPQASDQALVTVPMNGDATGYYDNTSSVTVNIANLNPGNIKAGVAIGRHPNHDANSSNTITGTFTSDATATAADILSGKTAYVNGSKLTGTASAGKKVASGTHTFTGAYKYSLSTTINVGFRASKFVLKFNQKFPNFIYNSEVTGIPIDTVYTNAVGSWTSYGRGISGTSISASINFSVTDTGLVLTFYAYTSEALWGNGSYSISWFAVE